jgi:osmotically-inducible protein OsmY
VPTERVARTPPPPPEVDQTPAVVVADNLADERIGREIGDVLASAKALEGFHVLVEVTDGEVYLSGTVADQTVRSEVERLSSSVRGAKRIHNELEVRH